MFLDKITLRASNPRQVPCSCSGRHVLIADRTRPGLLKGRQLPDREAPHRKIVPCIVGSQGELQQLSRRVIKWMVRTQIRPSARNENSIDHLHSASTSFIVYGIRDRTRLRSGQWDRRLQLLTFLPHPFWTGHILLALRVHLKPPRISHKRRRCTSVP